MKGNPARTLSIRRWKVDPAFRKPNGIRTNSYRPKGIYNGGLRDVVGKHLDLVVPLHKVKSGEHMGAGQVIPKIPYVRNVVLVWNRRIVESSKISTGAPRTVWLRHHVKSGGPR